jgi:uncharacterized membrane protein
MIVLPFFRKKRFFDSKEEKQIMESIRLAERASSGEVRVYVESHCKKPVSERTIEIFKRLKMQHTRERNGVLIYIAMDDHKFSIFGDEGIHKKLGFSFWHDEAATLKSYFERDEIIGGICQVITDIGEKLKAKFPHPPDDKNELPDEIVYGR